MKVWLYIDRVPPEMMPDGRAVPSVAIVAAHTREEALRILEPEVNENTIVLDSVDPLVGRGTLTELTQPGFVSFMGYEFSKRPKYAHPSFHEEDFQFEAISEEWLEAVTDAMIVGFRRIKNIRVVK